MRRHVSLSIPVAGRVAGYALINHMLTVEGHQSAQTLRSFTGQASRSPAITVAGAHLTAAVLLVEGGGSGQAPGWLCEMRC